MSWLRSGFLLFLLVVVVNAGVPNYIKICNRKEADINACIINSVENLREKLIAGIPELTVPPLEPLALDDLRVNKGLKINLTDVLVSGAGKFEIKDLKSELEKNRFAVLINLPELVIKGKHVIDMELLTIPLKGHGPFSARFTEFNLAVKLKGRIVEDGGFKNLKFDPFETKVSISGEKELKIEGLFEDNPTLKMAGQAVISDNVDVFIEELLPEIEHSMSTTLTRLANKITTHFNYDELFPH